MRVIRLIAFVFFAFVTESLYATAQHGDILIVNGDTACIQSNPLEQYFSNKGKRTIGGIEMQATSTALWRGYIATWELENDSLFLVRMQTAYSKRNSREIDIRKEFGSDKIFAEWVTDTIICPQGELLKYSHMGYMSIYEGEKYYTFKQGKLIDTESITFLERDNTLLFPGDHFLRDTIKTAILKSIDSIERDSIDENEPSILVVGFNKDREISYISFGEEPKNICEEIILRNAKEALKGFPKLMKVNHKCYHPPTFELFFNVHCLKYPKDYKRV
jgi:hypothetical protein